MVGSWSWPGWGCGGGCASKMMLMMIVMNCLEQKACTIGIGGGYASSSIHRSHHWYNGRIKEREPPPHIIASVVEARAFYGIRGEYRVYYKILCRFLGGLAGKMRKTTRSSSDSLLR